MKRLLFVIFLSLAAVAPTTLHAADEPNFVRKEVIYHRKYGSALTMDVFTPQKNANGAGVIFCVSGGWFSNHDNITPGIPFWIQPFVDKGYAVFAVVHGSQPKYAIPEILDDMHRAVRFIKA